MAVKIPIVTVFDNKGLRQAQYQLKKVDGNINNLKRNFAIAGAAVAGFGLVIGKSVQSLARIEQINAQTEAVLKSMGQTAGVTSKDIQDLAGSLESLTATEAETIQEGANLLLTFRNVKNEAGAGNDIFNQTVTAMVDLARAMGTDASGEAVRLGKALNDPVKGISALTRVGVSFTEEQKNQIKALTESGDIMSAQKIILAELQAQFGGSGAAFAKTFAGQLELLGHELGTVGEEATMAVMPALQGMVQELRNLMPVIGPQLKAAIESVDWKGLVTTLVNLVTWFTENARVIGIVVGAMFALNTIYNAGRVAVGLYNAVATIFNTLMLGTATATGVATGALKLFRIALATTGVGAFVVALGFIIEGLTEADSSYRNTTPTITSWGGVVLKSGENAEWAAGKYGIAADAVRDYKNAIEGKPKAANAGGVLDSYGYNLKVDQPTPKDKKKNQKSLEKQLKDLLKGLETGGAGTKAAKDIGAKIGSNILTGVELYAKSNAKRAAEILGKFVEATPIKDEWVEFGNETGNKIIKGLQKSIDRMGAFVPTKSLKVYKDLYKKVGALQDAFVARTQLQTKIKEDIMSMFDFKTIKTGLSGIIKQFKQQVEQTKKFRDNLVELQRLGLSGDLFRKIAEGQDFNTAAELVKGGAAAVSEMNTLYGQLQGFSDEIATVSGNALYNLGVDSATGFVRTLEDGFLSLQSLAELEKKKARVLAAQEAAAALTPFNSGYRPDQIKAIQKKAAEDYQYYLGRFIDPVTGQKREGVLRRPLANAQLRANLDQYFLGGGQMNADIAAQLEYLGLGRRGQEQADLLAREQRRRNRGNSSVTVNVNGGISTSAQIGQSVVDAIRAYERSSGQVFASA